MSNIPDQEEKIAIIYNRTKLFYLKRIVNNFVAANPNLMPLQKEIEVLMRTYKNEQARSLILYKMMSDTEDPIKINLLGMNLDVIKYINKS